MWKCFEHRNRTCMRREVLWIPHCYSCGHYCPGWYFSGGCGSCFFLDSADYAPCALKTLHCCQLAVHLWTIDFFQKELLINNTVISLKSCSDKFSSTFCNNPPLWRTVREGFFLGGSITDSSRTPVPGVASRRFSMCRNYRGRTRSSEEKVFFPICYHFYETQIVLTAALDWAKLFHAVVSSNKEKTINTWEKDFYNVQRLLTHYYFFTNLCQYFDHWAAEQRKPLSLCCSSSLPFTCSQDETTANNERRTDYNRPTQSLSTLLKVYWLSSREAITNQQFGTQKIKMLLETKTTNHIQKAYQAQKTNPRAMKKN